MATHKDGHMSNCLSQNEFSENSLNDTLNQLSSPQQNQSESKNISKEPPKIFSSTDYKLFEPFHLQRKLQDRNLNRLRESIERHNLLHEYPITVLKPQGEVNESNRYQITNGNHRFTIALEKQLPIYFIIADDFHINDIVDTGYCLSKWTTPQFCEFYCKLGNQEYINFKKFCDDFKLDICTALPLSKRPSERKGLSNIFRSGEFVFNNELERRREVDEVCRFLDKCISYSLAPKSFFSNSEFFDAYIKLMKHDKYNFKEVMSKFDHKTIKLPKISNFSSNMEFFNFLKEYYLRIDPMKEFLEDA
jgi:hypothetical protein